MSGGCLLQVSATSSAAASGVTNAHVFHLCGLFSDWRGHLEQ